jgi:hypothetical protein
MKRPYLTLALCLAGCAARAQGADLAVSAPVVASAAAKDPTTRVRLAHTGPDTWTVDYAFPTAVDAVAFGRSRIPRAGWRVIEPLDARIAGAFVVAPHPFAALRFEIKTDTRHPEAEYAPFCRFTDSGRLVYMGQLAVARAACASTACTAEQGLSPGESFRGEITMVADHGARESVVVAGKSPAAEATVALTDDGTYAYFGDLAPAETEDLLGVYDRALPEWLRRRVAGDIPRMLALYHAKLGPLEGARPTVYVSFSAVSAGHSLGGGTLDPYVLAIDLQLGPELLDATHPETPIHIDGLVAHEAAHFWNGHRYHHSADRGSAWMHEGTADAMTLRALHAIGTLDDAAYRDRLSLAASVCALWLATGESITSSTGAGHSRAFYDCGSTLDLVAEAAVRRRDPSADLFTFWKRVFEEGKPTYEESHFLGVLGRLGGDHEVALGVQRLLHEKSRDPTGALRDLLHRVGLETTVSHGPFASAYEEQGSIPAVAALLPSACVEGLAFDGDVGVQPRVTRDGACPGLSKGDVIRSLAGVSIGVAGATAFAKGYASCAAAHTVEVVTTKKVSVKLACTPEPHAPPGYLTLTNLP